MTNHHVRERVSQRARPDQKLGNRLPRKLLQWQLRTLLLLIALIAICLACYMQWVAPYRRQFAARQQLEAIGGQVETEAAEPAWRARLVGREQFHRVVEYRNEKASVDDSSLARLGDLLFLQRLYLKNTNAGDPTAHQIGRLKDLRRLSLWNTRVTDRGLPSIARCTELRVLDLHTTCISDEGIESFDQLHKLRQLILGGAVCGPGLDAIARLPNLRSLDLRRTPVRFSELDRLAGSPMEQLWIDEEIPASAASALAQLPRLQSFHGRLLGSDDQTARQLARCRNLRSVDISGDGLTDRGAALLLTLPHLQEVTLHGQLTDATLARVEAAPQLREAELTGRFSLRATDRLASARSDLDLRVKTLLPEPYYLQQRRFEFPEQATVSFPEHAYRLRPLIYVWRADLRNFYRDPTEKDRRPLRANVIWPATLNDVLRLSTVCHRVEYLEFSRTTDVDGRHVTEMSAAHRAGVHPVMWSLEGIDQLAHLQWLRIRRVPREQLAIFETLPRLLDLIISDPTLSNEDLRMLRLPSSLESLYLNAPRVTQSGLEDLRSRFPGIKVVDDGATRVPVEEVRQFFPLGLPGNGVTPQRVTGVWQSKTIAFPCMEAIAGYADLEHLRLEGGVCGTIDCDPLAQLPRLRSLKIDSNVPREPIWRLTRPLATLTVLHLHRTTDVELRQLRYCPQLEELVLDDSFVSDRSFEQLAHTPQLRRLSLAANRNTLRSRLVRPWGPWITGQTLHRLRACPDLECLNLSGTHVRSRYLADLADLPRLKQLQLADTEIGDEACRYLAELPALETLVLGSTSITDEGLRELADCPRLRATDLTNTAVTLAGLEHLARCPSLELVVQRDTKVTASDVRKFLRRFPHVRVR